MPLNLSCNNVQKVRIRLLTAVRGVPSLDGPIQVTPTGEATVSRLDSVGAPLPNHEAYLLSQDTIGNPVTNFDVQAVQGGVVTFRDTATLMVVPAPPAPPTVFEGDPPEAK